jgi:hypothetical protein
MSAAPKPVAVRLCFGRLKPGPTGPTNVEMGAPIEGFRSLGAGATAAAAILRIVAMKAKGTAITRPVDQEVKLKGKLCNG